METLRERVNDVSLVFAVPEAYTPVIKFNFDDQPIDMLFVSLSLHTKLPEQIDALDISVLKGLDDQGNLHPSPLSPLPYPLLST